ncbi:arginine--tRNA ligase [Candidatus Woesearchaeota archaeon]|nr:arginine--tRNA ligase [Candidatus Woesearchaeota archaeon]
MNYKNTIIKLLKTKSLKVDQIEIPPDSSFGDFAVPCFILAKELKKSPDHIAKHFAKTLKLSKEFIKVEAVGPYLNFFVERNNFFENALTEKPNFKVGKSQKIVNEFSSPNTNKPLHLGHIRNNLLGESVSKLLEKTDNTVIRTCLVNDRGIHISKSMLAYQKFGKNKAPNKKSDHFVGDWYVRYNTEALKKPEIEQEAQAMLVDWEKNDNKVRALWKKMNTWVYAGFNETYKKLGIKFDKTYYESDHYDKGKKIVSDALKKNIFYTDDDGNVLAPLKKHGLPADKVVLRSDGTSVYITQDIYLAKQKHDDYKPAKSIYVVGSEQKLHFRQLFKILQLLGMAKFWDLYHLSYGMVYLPQGKMKSREGTVIDADDLIEQMTSLAKKEVLKRYKKLDKLEVEKRANAIGLSALKFFMLKIDPSKDMTYNPTESISFEGETGPYVQYTYARIKSIIRKAGKKPSKIKVEKVSDKEFALAKKLSGYSAAVQDAALHYKPSTICHYLLDLCQSFNNFYADHPVISSDKNVMNKRLLLISKIASTIKDSLAVLGIEVLEQM